MNVSVCRGEEYHARTGLVWINALAVDEPEGRDCRVRTDDSSEESVSASEGRPSAEKGCAHDCLTEYDANDYTTYLKSPRYLYVLC